jgi:putative addiction module killer protein
VTIPLSFRWSKEFNAWLHNLSDMRGKEKIFARLRYAELGNLGDCKSVGEGVFEMRIKAVGPGYRIYFMREGESIYLLLIGGDKGSQERDIAKAKTMASERKEGK